MFKLFSIRAVLISALLVIGFAIAAPSASAGDPQIDAAKAQGLVGETIDGYLGLTDAVTRDASLKRKVNEINARRRALFTQLAEDSGTTVEQVARVTGEKQLANAAPGQMIMGEDGVWTEK